MTRRTWPDSRGRYGIFGGRYVPETLMPALEALETAYQSARRDKQFLSQLKRYLADYAGRPTPLYEARRLSKYLGRGRIYLKREDLLHTGAHKINNTLGQALLAQRMGKTRIIAETGAGQHGVATATAAALLGIPCTVYMGEEDMRRQAPNVFRMELLGARVQAVRRGSRTLKDAVNEAIRDWVTRVHDTYYILGSCVGPHPYPQIVRDFQKVIGEEARRQVRLREAKDPDWVVACVGGGSNAIGIFSAFLDCPGTRLVGVEAGGLGLRSGRHSATLSAGTPGVLHGALSYLLQTPDGQVRPTHSISAGLDYPGVGPEHAMLRKSGSVKYGWVKDDQALSAFKTLCRLEGIIPALESAHALAWVFEHRLSFRKNDVIVVNLSGRGDKDIPILRRSS